MMRINNPNEPGCEGSLGFGATPHVGLGFDIPIEDLKPAGQRYLQLCIVLRKILESICPVGCPL